MAVQLGEEQTILHTQATTMNAVDINTTAAKPEEMTRNSPRNWSCWKQGEIWKIEGDNSSNDRGLVQSAMNMDTYEEIATNCDEEGGVSLRAPVGCLPAPKDRQHIGYPWWGSVVHNTWPCQTILSGAQSSRSREYSICYTWWTPPVPCDALWALQCIRHIPASNRM